MAKVFSPNEGFFAANPSIGAAVEARGIALSDIDVLDIKFSAIVRDVVNQMYDYFPATVQHLSVSLKDGRVVEIDSSELPRRTDDAS